MLFFAGLLPLSMTAVLFEAWATCPEARSGRQLEFKFPMKSNDSSNAFTSTLARRRYGDSLCSSVCIALLLVECIVGSNGCRAFRGRGPDGHAVRARQLSLRGADLLRRSKFDDAQTLFTEAIQNCPTDERAHWGYAATLWQSGQRDTAIEHMQEAVRLSGSNPEYLVRLGEMYLAVGNAAGARTQAELTLRSHRHRADAWALFGDSQSQSGDYEAALESYQRALLIQSDYQRVQLAIADCYRKIGRPLRSLATLDRMVDIHPTVNDTGETQLTRALALIDLDRRDEAVVALKAAADGMNGNTAETHIELVRAQCELGELVDARMSLGKLMQLYPQHPEVNLLQTQLNHSFESLANKADEPQRLLR